MKEKLSASGDLIIRQDLWNDSPCSSCERTPCCRNLPLSAVYLEKQKDFIDLILSSCYNGIYPALKPSGEWTIYLGRDCSNLGADGKCEIHKSSYQSLICKSYDAHKCWYTGAFNTEKFSSLVRFDTGMLVWFEKRYGLIQNRFTADFDWQEFCDAAYEYSLNPAIPTPDLFEPVQGSRLPFKKSRTEQHLFFPPYKRPENMNHLELISFRLGFPGVYLAVSDSCWAYTVKTSLNESKLNDVRREYYPAIAHKDGCFSFDSMMKQHHPFSGAGEQWVIIRRSELEILKGLTVFDSSGRIKKLPTVRELLSALSSRSPDKAA